MTIMLVEDNTRVAQEKVDSLAGHGIATILVGDTETAVELAGVHRPDALLASVTVPVGGAMELCRRLQAGRGVVRIPLLVYAGQYHPLEAALILDAGAADYFHLSTTGRELASRLRRAARWQGPKAAPAVLRVGQIVIDAEACEVTCRGRNIGVTATEFRILQTLTREAGVVLSRERIAESAGVERFDAADRTVDTHIKNLRRKLGDEAGCLQTVRGFGYRVRTAG